MAEHKLNRVRVYVILGVFILTGVGFSLVVPPFETPDEIYHFAFARHLAQGNPLPIQSGEVNGPWEQEGSQAPLYYLLAAGLTSLIDQNDFAAIAIYNPRANIGSPFVAENKNRMLYSAQTLPLRRSNLALHLGRWLSLLFGAITLWSVYQTALLLFGRRRYLALASVLFLALIPQFGFISASFSNDSLITAVSSVTVYWLAYLLVQSAGETKIEKKTQPWQWGLLGVLIGTAALSKLHGLGLIPLASVMMLVLAWRTKDWRTLSLRILWVALPALAIAGWWYWRNFTLYNDWLGTGNLKAITGERSSPLTWTAFWDEFRGVRYSFWGLFGWFNIPMPLYFYHGMDLLSLLALTGGGVALVRGKKLNQDGLNNDVLALLLAWTAIGAALMLYWMRDAMGGQGRLLFPAIGAIIILFIAGLDQYTRDTRWKFVPFAPALGIAVALAYVLFWLLPAAYQAPKPIAQLPASVLASDLRFVNDQEPALQLQLLAAEAPNRRFRVDELIPVTLYLRSNQTVQNDYQLFVQLLDVNGNAHANLTTHPGAGRNPTRLWQPNQIYRDDYRLQITDPSALQLPARLRLYVGFIEPGTEQHGLLPLLAYTAQGDEVTPIVAEIVVAPAQPEPQQDFAGMASVGVSFGGVIQLARLQAPPTVTLSQETTFTVTLLWQAIGIPATDYTAFVHLLSRDGQPLLGSDHAPAGERLPTRLWQAHDQILDQHQFSLSPSLPAGDYYIWVGLYETSSQGGLRLPISDAAGRTTGDGMVQAGAITIAVQ